MSTTLTLKLQRLGKKKVQTVSYSLPKLPRTLRELLCTCVRAEVERYNDKQSGKEVLPYLLPAQIDAQRHTGRVTFNDPAEKRLADERAAIDAALLGFEDGLFTVFVDDGEIDALDAPLHLSPVSTLTFIRLTFLAGSPW